MKRTIFAAMAAALMLTSCTVTMEKKSDRNSKEVTKTFPLSDFSAIAIIGSDNVEYVQDSVYKVEALGTEEDLERLELKVKNQVLTVGKKDSKTSNNINKIVFRDYTCVVKVHAPNISSAKIVGSGNFSITRPVTLDSFDMEIAGSGNIGIDTIEARNISVTIAGSGNVDMKARNADTTDLKIAGSGNIEAFFDKCGTVKTAVAGSGNITLKGEAKKLIGSSMFVDSDELKTTK